MAESGPQIGTCKVGHLLTPENVYTYNSRDGEGRLRQRRICRECKLARSRKTPGPSGPRRAPQDRPEDEMARVTRLTALQKQHERETRAWLRAELKEQIDREMRSHREVT